MGALLRFCRDFKWHPLALDHGLALTLLALNLIVPGSRHVGERIQLTPTVVVLTVVAAIALALRRLAPLVVLAVTTAVTITYLIVEQGKSPIVLFMACAVYTVVMEKDRRTRSIAVAVVALLTLVADAPVSDGNVLDNLGLMFLVLFAGAVAEAVRYRRALQQELEERALRAEQSREEEAQRRVIEERLRIAHELHDVIAHHIALMNVQSGVAAHVLRTQPEEAERALALVRSGGRTVLQELTVLLGVLRRSGSSLPTTPTPSLHELGALIASFTAAGVEVDWHLPDSLGDLPDVIELTAYRIVQESLTNVLKHAPGATAHLQLSRHPGTLTIDITNTAPPTSTRAKPLAPALTSASQPSAAGTLRHGEPRPSTIPKPHPNGAHPGPATSTPNADTATSAPRPGTSTPQPHDVHPGTSTSTPHPSDARPRPATSRSHPNEARPGAATSTPHPNDARPSATPGPTPGTPPPTPWADGGGPHPIAGSPAPQPAGPSLDSAGISTPHAGEATTSSPPRPNGAAPTANPARLGAGHGLVGMWERVTAVGGELRTGPEPGGGFGVHAVLPLETGDVSDDPGLAGRRPDADSQRVPGAGELSTRSGGRC